MTSAICGPDLSRPLPLLPLTYLGSMLLWTPDPCAFHDVPIRFCWAYDIRVVLVPPRSVADWVNLQHQPTLLSSTLFFSTLSFYSSLSTYIDLSREHRVSTLICFISDPKCDREPIDFYKRVRSERNPTLSTTYALVRLD